MPDYFSKIVGAQTPSGQTVFNPGTRQFQFLPTFDPSQFQSAARSDLMLRYLWGEEDTFGTSQANIRSQLEGLQEQLAGAYDPGQQLDFGDWLMQTEGQRLQDLDLKGRKGAMERYTAALAQAAQDYITPEEREQIEEKIGSLEGILANMQDIGELPYGSVKGPTEERLFQIGEQTGSLRDLLERGVTEARSTAMADLARRGLGGGTAEAGLAGEYGKALSDVDARVLQFEDQLRQQDLNTVQEMIQMIEGGQRADRAMAYGQEQAAMNYALAQQQLAQQAAQQEAALKAQKSQGLLNLLGGLSIGTGAALGGGLGNLFGGGVGEPSPLYNLGPDVWSTYRF